MNFELTKEHKAIQKAAREFAEGEFDKDMAIEHELNHKFPRELWNKACKLGFQCVHFPEEYGGQGYGLMEHVLVWEEFCRKDVGLGAALMLTGFASAIILKYGNEEQKAKYLPLVTSGKALSGGAFTEPDHGSDIARVDTTAVKDGGEWVINGTKMFITNGSLASFLVVLCQTDPNAVPSHKGTSTIIVETD
ncbi:MAG: acyl-CoA/acyl-ACP dehydrogenase, partial [Candidatus Marsarchaeota archaeon]|nr:acyl-CoA/acyl-ACP dehydrogenase [Candidatus Marsarchaeota archaeon]